MARIQRYRFGDLPDARRGLSPTDFDASTAASMDYLLGETKAVGRGLGTEMIRRFTTKLFADLGDVATVAVTPQAACMASCRALEKADYGLRWTGRLATGDPADEGEAALYVRARPTG